MAADAIDIAEPGSPTAALATQSFLRAAVTVHREEVVLGNGAGDTAIAEVLNVAPSAEFGLVTRNIPSGTQVVGDGGGALTVDAIDLDIRNLGASYVPDLSDRALRDLGKVDVAALDQYTPVAGRLPVDGSGVTQPISATALPLPAGAATSASQLPNGHDVTVDNAAGASAVNVQDGGNSLTVDGTVNIGTFPDNEPFNVAQVGGSAVEVAGAGRQEVLARNQTVDTLLSADGTARTIQYASVNATADGDNTIVAAVGGQSVYVLGYVLTATGLGTVLLQDSAGSPVVHGRIRIGADGGGASYAGGPTCPAFVTAVGTGLEINCPAGVDVLGHITYLQY